MGSFCDGDEEYHRYFDAFDDLSSSHSSPYNLSEPSKSSTDFDNKTSNDLEFKVWARTPQSVQERRGKFFDMMGLDNDETIGLRRNIVKERVTQSSGAVLRNSSFEDSRSSFSSLSRRSSSCLDLRERSGTILSRAETENNKTQLYRVLGLDFLERLGVSREFKRSLSSVRKSTKREDEGDNDLEKKFEKVKTKILSRLRSMTCIDKPEVVNNFRRTNLYSKRGTRVQRVKVRHCRKNWKELSALFTTQDFQAHKGSITTMKFSLDGSYLATAGEDCVVRVWQVVEDMRSNAVDIPEFDPSCAYFTMDHLSKLAPYMRGKERVGNLRDFRKTVDSACVIFPPRVFRILEEPIHQFRGHNGEILDLSWSKQNCLLSSSVDKTVLLWRVGFQQCIKSFPHSNYVTCIHYDPVDDNHFISGSIDGKIRIWDIKSGLVVDWADVRDIVSAVCYRPNGQGVVVGYITGVCRFYDISDDHFQLEAQINLHNKKKASCKRITGFQFLPQDPCKLMVTCADAKVRIIIGTNVVGKCKGDRCSGDQLCASFTSDGKHIISTSKDSNVYVWDYNDRGGLSISQPKIIKSWEKFSTNATVAIPWCGLKSKKTQNSFQFRFNSYSLSPNFFLESFPRVSATWPEEKLFGSLSPRVVTLEKAQYKFLRSCERRSSSHAWDLVIVTAGRDGRIRSFHNYGLPVAL